MALDAGAADVRFGQISSLSCDLAAIRWNQPNVYICRMIDGIDLEILKILQSNARTSNAEIARQVDLAPSAVFERIRKLEERGVIEGYSARINPEGVGLPLLAFIFVRDRRQARGRADRGPGGRDPRGPRGPPRCRRGLLSREGPGEGHGIARAHPARAARAASRSITSTRTTIVLGTVKEGSHLPIEAPAGPAPEPSVSEARAAAARSLRSAGSSRLSRRSTCCGARRTSASASRWRRCRRSSRRACASCSRVS